jgi:hypothetical protein
MRIINISADIAAMKAASQIKEKIESFEKPLIQEDGNKKKGRKTKGVQTEEV